MKNFHLILKILIIRKNRRWIQYNEKAEPLSTKTNNQIFQCIYHAKELLDSGLSKGYISEIGIKCREVPKTNAGIGKIEILIPGANNLDDNPESIVDQNQNPEGSKDKKIRI